ncbi:MAG: carboxymuconolactone decarboxylase family protein [Halobacteriota archaeon]
MPRIQPLDPAELPDEYPALEEYVPDTLKDEWGVDEEWLNTLSFLQILGNNPDVHRVHLNTFLTLWGCTGLSVRETEMVILVVSRALESELEWHVHAARAIAAGCTTDEIVAISRENYGAFDEGEAALLRYVRAVVDEEVTDELHDALAEYYDTSTIIGIMFLASYYRGYPLCLEALDWTLDDADKGEFIGWELEHYDSSHPVAREIRPK